MEQPSPPRAADRSASLATLCIVVGGLLTICGLGMIPGALFVGYHILAAVAVYIVVGVLFLRVADGLLSRRSWAYRLVVVLPLLVAGLAIAGVVSLLDQFDRTGVIVWSLVASFFLLFAWAGFQARPRGLPEERSP